MNKTDLLLFHIYGGGGNKKRLDFIKVGNITDCPEWNNLFETEEGLFYNDQMVMTPEELLTAHNTGEGILELDGYYNTYYTTKLEDIYTKEFKILDESIKVEYLVNVLGLDEYIVNNFLLEDLEYIYETGTYPSEINVNKNEYRIFDFISGYFGIVNSNGILVYGGDSACEDHYNKDHLVYVLDNWYGNLFFNNNEADPKYHIEL